MNFSCFIQDDNALMARNVKGCRYFHFPDDVLPDFMFDFELRNRIKIIGGVFDRDTGAVVFEDTPKTLSTLVYGIKQVKHVKEFDTDILAVKVGKKRIITILRDKFYVLTNILHSLDGGKFVSMPLNPKGIYAYVSSERLPYFAWPWYKSSPMPAKSSMSTVAILESFNEPAANIMSTIALMNIEIGKILLKIEGSEAIVALAFSSSGAQIVAAYVSGKQFHIYDSKRGCLISICNRGSTETITNSLLFSDCEKYLLSTSNKRKVQLFQLLPVPTGHFVVSRVESLCRTLLPERETGTGSIMAIKSIRNIEDDLERLRVMIITATSHMHLYVIKTVPATCILGAGIKDTILIFEKSYNLLEVKWPIRQPPFIRFNMELRHGSGAYDAVDASSEPAEDDTTAETAM